MQPWEILPAPGQVEGVALEQLWAAQYFPLERVPALPCRRGYLNSSRKDSDFGTEHFLQPPLARHNRRKSSGSSHSNTRAENASRQEHFSLLIQIVFSQQTKCRFLTTKFITYVTPCVLDVSESVSFKKYFMLHFRYV